MGGTKSGLYWISALNHDWEPGRNEDLDNFMNGQCAGDTTRSAANRLKGWIDNGDPYSFDLDNWHFAMLSSALWRYDLTAADATRWLDRIRGGEGERPAPGGRLPRAYFTSTPGRAHAR